MFWDANLEEPESAWCWHLWHDSTRRRPINPKKDPSLACWMVVIQSLPKKNPKKGKVSKDNFVVSCLIYWFSNEFMLLIPVLSLGDFFWRVNSWSHEGPEYHESCSFFVAFWVVFFLNLDHRQCQNLLAHLLSEETQTKFQGMSFVTNGKSFRCQLFANGQF